MGRRGPRPEPTVLKIARGNPGKRAINHEEPEFPDAELEAPSPHGLDGVALEEYNFLRPILIDAGVLTVVDESCFVTCCQLKGDIAEVLKDSRGLSLAQRKTLGYTKDLKELRAQHRQYMAELGITPSSRSSVKIASDLRRKRAEQVDANAGKRDKFFGNRGSA